MEAACQVKEDVANDAKSYCEGDKVLMVHGGANKAGRSLEVSVYAKGGRKGVLWLPEGCFGQGWRCFVGELHLMLVPPNGKIGSEVIETRLVPRLQLSPTKHARDGVTVGCTKDHSFGRSWNRSLDLRWRIGHALRQRKAGLLSGLWSKMAWMFLCWRLVLQGRWGAIPSKFGSISC